MVEVRTSFNCSPLFKAELTRSTLVSWRWVAEVCPFKFTALYLEQGNFLFQKLELYQFPYKLIIFDKKKLQDLKILIGSKPNVG